MRYKDLAFDYECGIELFTVCNYHCEYCSGPRVRKAMRRGTSQEDAEQVVRFFNGTGKRWLLGFSGGEPTIHPQFSTLVRGLREQHLFYFFTNLSFDLDWFMGLVPPDRVQYIKASLHPAGDVDDFMGKFDRLATAGYNPVLIMVSAPDQFSRIEQVADQCRGERYPFTLSVMEGPYRGRNYPNDYTEEEQAFIERHTEEPGNLIRLFSKSPGGMNTFGAACPAGQQSFYLDMETGDLMTCESVNKVHGNLYRGDFSPQNVHTVCPAINGCVGYDRCLFLPETYQRFYRKERMRWELRPVKEDPAYPGSLYETVRIDTEGADRIVQASLGAIYSALEGKKALIWGAGIYGAKLLYYLRQMFGEEAMRNVAGFVDSLPDRQKEQVLGLPVHAPDSPIVKNAELILIASYAYERDIEEQAHNIGIQGQVIPLHRTLLEPLGIKVAIF